jgi:DNA-binding XRE family transcriptional regulator
MKKEKRERLEEAGWRVGTTSEFLELPPEEAAYVELKLGLSAELRVWRKRGRLTQAGLARRLGSSQSRVAKMEAGDPSVSIDLLLRALFAVGASRTDIAAAIQREPIGFH